METGLKEIQNLKNTCYINSVIQLLSHIDPIRSYFCTDPPKISPNLELLYEFSLLVNKIWEPSQARIIPKKFITTLFKIFKNFPPYTQQDSQEFLTILLDKLDSELAQHTSTSPSFLQPLFQGSYFYNHECQICLSSSKNIDYYQQLLIPIPIHALMSNFLDSLLDLEETKILSNRSYSFWDIIRHPTSTKAHLNIYYCLQEFFSKQVTEKYCQTCGGVTNHWTSIDMNTFPEYLVIGLKRFKYSIWGSKVSDMVYLSKKLKFRKIKKGGKDSDYVLTAVIEHSGMALRGHYRVYINHCGEWWLLDDKRVRRRTFKQVFESQAYIAVYTKKSKWKEVIRLNEVGVMKCVEEALSEGEVEEKYSKEGDLTSRSQQPEDYEYEDLKKSDD